MAVRLRGKHAGPHFQLHRCAASLFGLSLQYDSRYAGSLHSRHSMDLDGSQHLRLASVPEDETPRETPQATPRS